MSEYVELVADIAIEANENPSQRCIVTSTKRCYPIKVITKSGSSSNGKNLTPSRQGAKVTLVSSCLCVRVLCPGVSVRRPGEGIARLNVSRLLIRRGRVPARRKAHGNKRRLPGPAAV